MSDIDLSRAGQTEKKTGDFGDDVPERDNTLTDAEREAIDEAVNFYGGVEEDARCQSLAVTLRGLLARTQNGEK
jgi:hypothetical protein